MPHLSPLMWLFFLLGCFLFVYLMVLSFECSCKSVSLTYSLS